MAAAENLGIRNINQDQQQFSPDVIHFQKRVEDLIAWICEMEERFQKRASTPSIKDSSSEELLDQYSDHEKHMTELSRYNPIINQCRDDGEALKNRLKPDEQHEVAIQIDALMSCYEKLKILSIEKLQKLQSSLEERQQSQIDRFDEWLSSVEGSIASSNMIGPDYQSIEAQKKDLKRLQHELEMKQEFLNCMSKMILVFDEVDPETLQIRSISCDDLDDQLSDLNHRWTEVCEYVDRRGYELRNAESAWRPLLEDGSKLSSWMRRIENRLEEMESAARDFQSEPEEHFIDELRERYLKIDSDIKNKQLAFRNLETKTRQAIDKFDDSCSMLVIEIERKIEDLQDAWASIVCRQRELQKYLLGETSDFISIPIPEPITSRYDIDTTRGSSLSPRDISPDPRNNYHSNSNQTSSNSSFHPTKLSNSNFSQGDASNNHHDSSYHLGSTNDVYKSINDIESRNQHHLPNGDIPEANSTSPKLDSCRVEEWKHALESFSLWLKQVETSLGVNQDITEEGLEPTWSRLSLHDQSVLLDDIEQQVVTTCRDEFDCLILQGQQIIEDLSPEIDENDLANLRSILNDIDDRWNSVKQYLTERRKEIFKKDRWSRFLTKLRELNGWLKQKGDDLMPESDIGGDLITLAQQQDYLMQIKGDLNENSSIEASLAEAKLFLKMFDDLEQKSKYKSTELDCILDYDIKLLKEDIDAEMNKLSLHYSELSQQLENRICRLDEVHREMHSLQQRTQEFATKLQVAEILRSNWQPVALLTIDQLSEQLEDLKLFRERLTEIETVHKQLNGIFEWMTNLQVPLSQANLKRLSELNTIWSLFIIAVDERQKSIEQAFDNQGFTEQSFLTDTVKHPWERRVAASKVPYFVDHSSEVTNWDHPAFSELMSSLNGYNEIIYSAYRTAMKLRAIQKRLGIDLLMLETFQEIFDEFGLRAKNEKLIGANEIIRCLKIIFERLQMDEKRSLDMPLCVDLSLNWLLNLFDCTRTGYIRILSFKIGLTLLCCATREEKCSYMFQLVSNQQGIVDDRKLSLLFEDCIQIPRLLGEMEAFGGQSVVEESIRSCFSQARYNPNHPSSIVFEDFFNWLRTEPQFIIWLPVLHRIIVSEKACHNIKCKICRVFPIVGLRYRCLKCFNYDICQDCFMLGRNLLHHKKATGHPFQEYWSIASPGENVRDMTKILRNKLRPKNFMIGN